MNASLLPGRYGAVPRVGAARAWSAAVFALAAVVICGSRLSFEGRGAVVLEQPDRLSRLTARLDLHKSVHHGSDSQMRQWHEDHAPEESSFSVMHVVPLPSERAPEAKKPAPAPAGAQAGLPAAKSQPAQNALMSHADMMLRKDNEQLQAENKRFQDSKPKGLSDAIENNKERSEHLEKEAVDHQMQGQYRSREAEREASKSDIEAKRGDIAEALAHEYQSKIEQHKRELAEERKRMIEEKDERTAEAIRERAERDKDKALEDARLAGRLDDKADESRVEQRRVHDQEQQSQLQLKQLNDEIQRAEAEAKRARADSHALRVTAATDARDAKVQLAKAEGLIKHAAHQRMEARTKRGEITSAQSALKTASSVEKQLTVRAAQYTGKAKLEVLQSKLLKQAAAHHNLQAKAVRHKAEARQEGVEKLEEAEERAENAEHDADVRVRRLHDRLELDRRRARRRLERARAAEDKAQEAFKAAQSKYQLDSE